MAAQASAVCLSKDPQAAANYVMARAGQFARSGLLSARSRKINTLFSRRFQVDFAKLNLKTRRDDMQLSFWKLEFPLSNGYVGQTR
jgi:hypothetical protein